LALEKFFNDHRQYPTNSNWKICLTGSGGTCTLSTGKTSINVYLTSVPVDPLNSSDYSYTQQVNGQKYTLTATLENGTAYSVTSPTDN
jgi:hypothetical protein